MEAILAAKTELLRHIVHGQQQQHQQPYGGRNAHQPQATSRISRAGTECAARAAPPREQLLAGDHTPREAVDRSEGREAQGREEEELGSYPFYSPEDRRAPPILLPCYWLRRCWAASRRVQGTDMLRH
ncbi:uncharacterized protein LOC101781003 [Setaria italica]|uniref:uncharacterized protein LOC101781003 n=1 Tax=Setaria italica TaxID=4555 RepID=UPI000BE5CEE5|nr:uncharacterized protein LOC101781003 [Setaria italica]